MSIPIALGLLLSIHTRKNKRKRVSKSGEVDSPPDKKQAHGSQSKGAYSPHADERTLRLDTGQTETDKACSASHARDTEQTISHPISRRRKLGIWLRKASPVVTAFATLVIMGATIVYAIYAGGQWHATREEATTAKDNATTVRKELELTERPWMQPFVSIVKPLEFNELGAVITLNVAPKNIGHSVAIHVGISADLILYEGPSFFVALKKRDELCAELKQVSFPADTVFPNSAISQNIAGLVSKQELSHAFSFNGPNKPPLIGFFVVGCVDYQFSFALGHHQTRFAYMLGKREPDGAIMTGVSPNGVVEDLDLVEIPDGVDAN
jgi:hypothetical protein